VGLAASLFAGPAGADGVAVTLTLSSGGTLSVVDSGNANLETTLDGADQSVSYTIPLTVTDQRPGKGAGWNLTITSTTFTDDANHSLAADASHITSVATACVGRCSLPRDLISSPVAVPAATLAPAAVKFFDAQARSGTGVIDVAPTIAVSIPGNSYAGTYSSTLDIAISSGP
jgi:hypothetical protein